MVFATSSPLATLGCGRRSMSSSCVQSSALLLCAMVFQQGRILRTLALLPLGLARGVVLQDLLPAAINEAVAKSKQMHVTAMKQLTGGISLPGMDDLINQYTGEVAGDVSDEPPSDSPNQPGTTSID